jgi:hypothetical protein
MTTFFDIPEDVRKIIWTELKMMNYKSIYNEVLKEMYLEYFLITKNSTLTWDEYYMDGLSKGNIHCGGMIFRDLKKKKRYTNDYITRCRAFGGYYDEKYLSFFTDSWNY